MFAGLRKFMNDNPLLAAGGLLAAIVICIVAVRLSGSGDSKSEQMYFSSDNGASWYKGAARPAPFTSGGKEVDEAVIFSCSDGKEFIGYLRKYDQKYHAAVEAALSSKTGGRLPPCDVKKPNGTEWVAQGDSNPLANMPGAPPMSDAARKYEEITQVKCPEGKLAILHVAN